MKAKTSKRRTVRHTTAPGGRPPAAAKASSGRQRAAPGEVETAEAEVKPAAAKAAAQPMRAPAARAKRKAIVRRPKLAIPPILLEGDSPAPPTVSGPGERYALGPVPPAEHFAGAKAELPEAYGTRRLFLTARDPHWLYAHWDLTPAQQRLYNARSVEGHLVLRVYVNEVAGEPLTEMHVHPESRHWFVHGGRGGTKYLAELGYYGRRGDWMRVSVSDATLTPADTLAEEAPVEFATIPLDFPLPRLLELVKRAALEHTPLVRAIEELRAAGHPALPRLGEPPPATWTPEQERALAAVVSMDAVRRVWIGSLEITELIRREHLRQLASPTGAEFGWPISPGGAVSSVSSPFGGAPPGAKGFWFNVNAELIVYGATEPDASLSIGGRVVRLRADGSFSYRFALPDGRYDLPVVAVSADQTDGRAAELKFSRQTEYRGEVGVHPQDPNLKPPTPESV